MDSKPQKRIKEVLAVLARKSGQWRVEWLTNFDVLLRMRTNDEVDRNNLDLFEWLRLLDSHGHDTK